MNQLLVNNPSPAHSFKRGNIIRSIEDRNSMYIFVSVSSFCINFICFFFVLYKVHQNCEQETHAPLDSGRNANNRMHLCTLSPLLCQRMVLFFRCSAGCFSRISSMLLYIRYILDIGVMHHALIVILLCIYSLFQKHNVKAYFHIYS